MDVSLKYSSLHARHSLRVRAGGGRGAGAAAAALSVAEAAADYAARPRRAAAQPKHYSNQHK